MADNSTIYKDLIVGPLTITQANGNLLTTGTLGAGATTVTSLTDSGLANSSLVLSNGSKQLISLANNPFSTPKYLTSQVGIGDGVPVYRQIDYTELTGVLWKTVLNAPYSYIQPVNADRLFIDPFGGLTDDTSSTFQSSGTTVIRKPNRDWYDQETAFEVDNSVGDPIFRLWPYKSNWPYSSNAMTIVMGGGSTIGVFDFNQYNAVGSDNAAGFAFVVGNDPNNPGSFDMSLHLIAGTPARVMVGNGTDDGSSEFQVTGRISTNSGLPTSDPADGKHTLWADPITHAVFEGT